MSEFVKYKLLTEIALSIVSQANQIPQMILIDSHVNRYIIFSYKVYFLYYLFSKSITKKHNKRSHPFPDAFSYFTTDTTCPLRSITTFNCPSAVPLYNPSLYNSCLHTFTKYGSVRICSTSEPVIK